MDLGSSHLQQSTTFTPKNELLQDQNFNYRISKAFILKLTKIDKNSSKLFANGDKEHQWKKTRNQHITK